MTDTERPRLSRLIRDTEGLLLPLTEVADDVAISRIEFGFDLPPMSTDSRTPDRGVPPGTVDRGFPSRTGDRRILTDTVVLVTDPVHSRTGLDAMLTEYAGAAALVVPPGTHSHLGGGTDLRSSADQDPVLLERSPHVTWSEILVHLRQLTEGATSVLAWPDVDDLSALAAVIAESTGASITIEDPASRVLAHANLGGELDEIRRETILSGAIPDWRIAELEESGFLDTIRRSADVVERPAEGTSPARSVIALRSEGELIGTIWAAYPAEVDPEPLREVLRDAARAALPVMLRTLRRSPFEKRIRREALGAILAGSADLGPSATLLSLPFSGNFSVLAFTEVAPDREPVLRFHLRAAFADAVLSHVGSGNSSSAPGRAGQRAHLAALVQMSEPMSGEQVRDHVLTVLRRSLPETETLCFGVGAPVDRLDAVHRSWTEAAYVVDAVRSGAVGDRGEDALGAEHGRAVGSGAADGRDADASRRAQGRTDTSDRIGTHERVIGATSRDVAAKVIGLQVADVLLAADGQLADGRTTDRRIADGGVADGGSARTAGRMPGSQSNPQSGGVLGPARALAAHDAHHNGSLLETLRVYFATVGNSAEASRRLHVHTNSLRHRLGRIEEITGLSTAEPAERLWLELSVLAHDRS